MREITPCVVHPPPPLRPNIGPGQNNCNSIVRHDFCFLYTILTAVVRSENIIMPFLAPDRSSHILLEKYGYYTWPITVLDQLLAATRFFMIIPLFYSRLMLKTISAGPGSPPSEPGSWLVSARRSLGPAPATLARTLTILELAANSSEKRKNSAPTETRKLWLLRFKIVSDIWVIFWVWVQPNLNVKFKLFQLSEMQAWRVLVVGYIASDHGWLALNTAKTQNYENQVMAVRW